MSSFNPLEKIVFKKGVFEDLSNFAKNYQKIAILTSKTPKKLYISALIGFLNEKNINFFTCEFNSEIADHENIIKAASKCQGCDLIISFGAGKVTDLSKLVAKSLKIPFVVVPSTISHFGYFTNYAYKTNALTTEKVACEYPLKVFIDENIIKSSPDNFIFSTCCFIFSFYETIFSELIKNQMFASDNSYQINALKRILNKTEGLLNWLSLNKNVAVLNLMDNLIELFSIVNSLDCDIPQIEIASMPQVDNINLNFGKRTLIYTASLLNIYLSFWGSKNICYKNIPDYENVLKILQKNGKNSNFFENFVNKYQNVTSNEFFFKAKMIKPRLHAELILLQTKLSKVCKRLMNLYTKNEMRMLNECNFYDNISYIAISSNCFQLNSLMRLGYLNFA